MNIQGYRCEIEKVGRRYIASFPQLPFLRAAGATYEVCEAVAEALLTEHLSESNNYYDDLIRNLEASGATNSVQSTILDAIVAILGGSAAGAYRCRFMAFSPDELKVGADNVLPDAGDADIQDDSDIERHFKFMIRHTAAAVDGADLIADARYVTAQKKLLADLTLGGLVKTTHEISTKWEMQEGKLDTIAMVATYEVEFSTTRTDPSVAGF